MGRSARFLCGHFGSVQKRQVFLPGARCYISGARKTRPNIVGAGGPRGSPAMFVHQRIARSNAMPVSKRALLSAGAGLVVAASTAAVAQTTPKGNKKSAEAGTLGEGEAYMLGPQGRRLHKSHGKVTAAQHEAAMKKGA